jgi:NOL1/NOP2/fmu family ribosome biogenesis protein
VLGKLSKLFSKVEFGLELGIFDSKKSIFKPKNTMAWAMKLDLGDLTSIELSQKDLIRNARGEALHMQVPKGYVLLTFKGLTVAIAKSTGSRINSLQEKYHRIKKNIEEDNFFSIFKSR